MEIVMLLLKFIGISTMLTILYYIAYARSASYLHCRIYLLAILLISATVSLSKFEVYPATIQTIEISTAQEEIIESEMTSNIPINEVEDIHPTNSSNLSEMESVNIKSGENRSLEMALNQETPLSTAHIILIVYLLVTTLLLLRYFYQLYKIIDITRWGSITVNSNYKLVRNNKVTSPFSYFKYIYINRKLNDETLDVVLNHEICHIKHRHYIDATIIELISIILWFNPLTWVIKHELRNIHEFQVDSSMIRNGLDIPKYQSIIFAELMGYSPTIANGFHNSLIKKRFIMMTQNRTIKYRRLRKLLVIPTILGIFVLFSFTDKGNTIRYVTVPNQETVENNEKTSIPTEVATNTETPIKRIETLITPQRNEENRSPKVMTDTLIIETIVTKTRKNDKDSIISKTITKDSVQYIELNRNQIVISNIKTTNNAIRYIDVKEDRTLITFVMFVNSDRQTIQFHSHIAIEDSRILKKLPIIGISHNIPLNKNLVVIGMKGKCVEFTLTFPPLESETTEINILGKSLEHANSPIGLYKNLHIEKYKRVSYKYNNLTSEQTPTTELGSRNNIRLLSVVRTDNETLVTYSSYVCFDAQWNNFGNGILIRDCKTKEKYYITRVEKSIPMNQLNVITGKKGKYVMFTLVFPRLPDHVEKIDIIETPHKNDIQTPEDGEPFYWININLKNNRFDAKSPSNQSVIKRTHPENRYLTIIESDDKPKMELEINNNRSSFLTITLTKNEVINIPYNFAIRDVVSGKVFRAKRVQPYNFDLPVGGQKKDKILIHFDNIPYGIDRIDIGVFTKTGEKEHDWSYKNLKINN